MQIDDKLIDYLQELARLNLNDGEREDAKDNLGKILGYMNKLGELALEGVEEQSHPLSFSNRFREDEVRPSASPEDILANAPRQKDNCFMVPKTVE